MELWKVSLRLFSSKSVNQRNITPGNTSRKTGTLAPVSSYWVTNLNRTASLKTKDRMEAPLFILYFGSNYNIMPK